MIVGTFEDLRTTGSCGEKPGVWMSARHLLRRDGLGFTLTETPAPPSAPLTEEPRCPG